VAGAGPSLPRTHRRVLTGLGVNVSGWSLTNTDISADGQTIVGYGTDPSGQTEAWIATIPEPSTGLLALTGLVGLAVRRRRARGVSLG